MVFGGVCATVTSIIAESLKGWNLVQVRHVMEYILMLSCVSGFFKKIRNLALMLWKLRILWNFYVSVLKAGKCAKQYILYILVYSARF